MLLKGASEPNSIAPLLEASRRSPVLAVTVHGPRNGYAALDLNVSVAVTCERQDVPCIKERSGSVQWGATVALRANSNGIRRHEAQPAESV